jgi:hypothetical protein
MVPMPYGLPGKEAKAYLGDARIQSLAADMDGILTFVRRIAHHRLQLIRTYFDRRVCFRRF